MNNKNIIENINETRKKFNFSTWFNEIIETTEIMDLRYPVKGLYVWYPFGFKIRNNVFNIIKKIMDDSNHEEVLFPSLIPRTEFLKESQHIKGFEDEVFWITHGGNKKLDIDLALRPTSETSIYPILKLWIRSHNDLPMKIYQIVNTFRYETKSTKPLIRLREITSFKEAHTIHETWDQANEQVKIAVQSYQNFFKEICIPFIISKRPEWDKFPGGDFTIAFDTIMPDGKTLQIGTIHHLGTNFSRTYDIKYENINGIQEFAYQTCYGISERCIAAIIGIHGDDKGLILPSNIAPIQIVIIPIIFGNLKNKILNYCNNLYFKLKNKYRVVIDNEKKRPGLKYYKWEKKGVCIRIEVGPKDLENNMITLITRSNNLKEKIEFKDVDVLIDKKIKEEKELLYLRALNNMNGNIIFCEKIENIKNQKSLSVFKIPLCESAECGLELESKTNFDVLGEPIYSEVKNNIYNCSICKKETSRIVYISKKY